ncbi:hypothetical protein GGI43DRAFT_313587 [Trichoderma evansii]
MGNSSFMREYGILLVCAETAVAFRDKCGLLLIDPGLVLETYTGASSLSGASVPLHDYVLRKADKGDCMQAYKRYGVSTISSAPVQVTCDEKQNTATCLSLRNKLLGASIATLQQLLALQQSSYKHVWVVVSHPRPVCHVVFSPPMDLVSDPSRSYRATSTPPHPRPLSAPKRRPSPCRLSRTTGLWWTLVGGAGIKEWHSCTTPSTQSPNEERFQVSGCPPLVD